MAKKEMQFSTLQGLKCVFLALKE